jgi:hypothetical protein
MSIQVTTWHIQAVDPTFGQLTFLYIPAELLANVPVMALLMGLVTVCYPQLRRWWVERRYRLQWPIPPTPSVVEMTAFVQHYAPHLAVKVNPRSSETMAFVYPSGYREATVALFVPIMKLWRSDRQAAEAVLLHEIAHYCRGDLFVIGAGSMLEPVLKYLLLGHVIVQLLIFVITVNYFATFEYFTTMQWLLLATLVSLVRFVRPLIMPLTAIWSAELNADRYACDQQKTSRGIHRGLSTTVSKLLVWQKLVFLVAHPPYRLRRWISNHADAFGLSVLLLLFPLAYIFRLLTLHAESIVRYTAISMSTDEIWHASLQNTVQFIVTGFPIWLVITIILLLWPVLLTYWEHLFTRDQVRADRADYHVYGLCACAIGGLCLVSIAMR